MAARQRAGSPRALRRRRPRAARAPRLGERRIARYLRIGAAYGALGDSRAIDGGLHRIERGLWAARDARRASAAARCERDVARLPARAAAAARSPRSTTPPGRTRSSRTPSATSSAAPRAERRRRPRDRRPRRHARRDRHAAPGARRAAATRSQQADTRLGELGAALARDPPRARRPWPALAALCRAEHEQLDRRRSAPRWRRSPAMPGALETTLPPAIPRHASDLDRRGFLAGLGRRAGAAGRRLAAAARRRATRRRAPRAGLSRASRSTAPTRPASSPPAAARRRSPRSTRSRPTAAALARGAGGAQLARARSSRRATRVLALRVRRAAAATPARSAPTIAPDALTVTIALRRVALRRRYGLADSARTG